MAVGKSHTHGGGNHKGQEFQVEGLVLPGKQGCWLDGGPILKPLPQKFASFQPGRLYFNSILQASSAVLLLGTPLTSTLWPVRSLPQNSWAVRCLPLFSSARLWPPTLSCWYTV